jgi:hypothetical protein
MSDGGYLVNPRSTAVARRIVVSLRGFAAGGAKTRPLREPLERSEPLP